MSHAGKAITVLSVGGSQCPFLYQTRTIVGQRANRQQYRSIRTTNVSLRADHHSSRSQAPVEPRSFLKQKAAQVTSRKPRLGSSITPAEQAAFDSVWALFEKPSPSTPEARATSIDHTDTDHRNILDLFSPPLDRFEEPILDVSEAVATDGPGFPSTATTSTTENENTRSSPFGTRFPRQSHSKLNREGAMAEVQGFLRGSTTTSELPPSTSASKATDEIRSAALKIIEDAADSFSTALASRNPRPDIAMWKVAEEKVFPLIKLLRPAKSTLSPEPSTTHIAAPDPDPRTAIDQAQQPLPHQGHPSIPSHLPLLPLLSLTYPSLTLLTLRLYATHHPTSPYALTLLPTLKTLGPTSYVLGAHTHFYNTLLSLYWRIYSDLRGMNDLLAEMEANAVDFDVGTWEVLKGIGSDRDMDRSGRAGGRGKLWWTRTEQVVWWERVGIEWRDVVKARLQESGVVPGDVIREDGVVGVGDRRLGGGVDRPDYVVTL